MPSLILASGSRHRKQQLTERLGLTVEAVVPNIDESPLPNESALNMSKRLSIAKANAVASKSKKGAIIIAGDQTAQCQGEQLRKPTSKETAFEQLTFIAGKTLEFYSGICVLETATQLSLCDSIKTTIRLRELSKTEIERYLEFDKPYDCLGSFKSESRGIALFESIESSDPSAITGLPIITAVSMLAQFGVQILTV